MARYASLAGIFALTLAACRAPAGGAAPGVVPNGDPPALAAIVEAELRRDLFALGGDAMRGREAGTLDELRAAAWVAERAREAGLRPAGDDGTYFQWWPMRRVRTAERSSAAVRDAAGGERRVLIGSDVGSDAVPLAPVDARGELPVVFVGEGRDADLAGVDVAGKAVVAVLTAPANVPPANVSLRAYRYALAAARERAAALARRGPAAVVLVSDAVAEEAWPFAAPGLLRGRYAIDSGAAGAVATGTPVLWARRALLEPLRRPGARLALALAAESYVYPSANVVAVAPGRDARLTGEHVLFSGHHDHDGVRAVVDGDSIWNGADDNATVSVSMLAIARAFARAPGRRSALFVWHGAEERGLLGSRWYAARPTVPRGSIVAVLNGDMLGRNHPDSAALLGAQPPHRNSPDLVAAALGANARVSRFALDSLWDRPSHPEGWYFRSDHLPYARLGIPAVFFTTLLHPDYHTPRDAPETIDVAKLARVTRWIYATGWAVAEREARPGLEPGFRLER